MFQVSDPPHMKKNKLLLNEHLGDFMHFESLFFFSVEMALTLPPYKGFKKKLWNFPYFGGVCGFENVIFHKKHNMLSKCIKSPKCSFKSNLFFSYGGRV